MVVVVPRSGTHSVSGKRAPQHCQQRSIVELVGQTHIEADHLG